MLRHIQPFYESVHIDWASKKSQAQYEQLYQLWSTVGSNTAAHRLVHKHQPIVHLLVIGIHPHVHIVELRISQILASSVVVGKFPDSYRIVILVESNLLFLARCNEIAHLAEIIIGSFSALVHLDCCALSFDGV